MDTQWASALATLGELLADEDRSEVAAILRQFHLTLCLAPEPVVRALGVPCDAATRDALLAAAAPRELVFRLLDGAGYVATVSRAQGGQVLASVDLAELFEEAHGSGPDEATAIVAAIAGGLARWEGTRSVGTASATRH